MVMLFYYYLWSSIFCFVAGIAIGVASVFVDASWSTVFGQYVLLLCGCWFVRQANREIDRIGRGAE